MDFGADSDDILAPVQDDYSAAGATSGRETDRAEGASSPLPDASAESESVGHAAAVAPKTTSTRGKGRARPRARKTRKPNAIPEGIAMPEERAGNVISRPARARVVSGKLLGDAGCVPRPSGGSTRPLTHAQDHAAYGSCQQMKGEEGPGESGRKEHVVTNVNDRARGEI